MAHFLTSIYLFLVVVIYLTNIRFRREYQQDARALLVTLDSRPDHLQRLNVVLKYSCCLRALGVSDDSLGEGRGFGLRKVSGHGFQI